MSAIEIHGFCDDRFAKVRDTFETNFQRRGDVGASFALTLEGQFVVDLWAGHRDAAQTLPWEADTLVNVYSTTKTMAALCLLILADRGVVDLNAAVADYWPEFAQNGKDAVQVKHFMSHSAGVPGFVEPIDAATLYDWDAMVQRLAAEPLWWEPGTASGYHAITQGHLIGEVVRRVTGKSLGTFFAEEVAGPLQADFHIGLDPREFPRVGELIPAPGGGGLASGAKRDSIGFRALTSIPTPAEASSSEAWRTAEIPAANGHGNARSVVRAQTAIANDGRAFGVELLSPATIGTIFEEQTSGIDLCLNVPITFGMGYGLNSALWPLKPTPEPDTCYWGGWGGSLVFADTSQRICSGYVMNAMTATTLGDRRAAALAYATYECLGLGR
jgi:CubicO group peptidase (beta-lactamase class C family)